ncbi:MAG TPA: hypothetical protein P5572_16315 [Phycisphaerae bacterium]|nr:hypothetical protein [Phycisphaerales bacterium]HRX86588.1 hypothetical protein [Phycisphaerae bacterium]
MTETPIQRVRRHLADIWRLRLALLHDALAGAPDSTSAPHWLMRVRILRFLLGRYGDDPGLDAVDPPAPPLFAQVQPDDRELGAPPRSRDEIRYVLTRIADQNEQVRGDLITCDGRVLRVDLARWYAAYFPEEARQDQHSAN